jgi:sugar lactone lactonase YvrE
MVTNSRIPLWIVAAVPAFLLLLAAAAPRAAGCEPAGNVRFICDQLAPEDLSLVPGGEWVISSGMAANGAIRAISLRDKTTTVLFPSASARVRPDTKIYNSCPGPIDPDEKDKFRAHGLYLRAGKNAVHTLYVVHHGNRESIEVFELDARARPPVLTWTGCAIAPDPIGLNSVVGLPDGGFVTTNFSPRGQDAAARTRMMAGENNGELWEWHTASGWKKVPGSEAAGPNGLEISSDGKWLYVGGWGSQSVIRLSRGQTPVKRDSVPAGFRVDNLRLTPDGSILAAGQGGTAPTQTSHVGRFDPKTMKFQELIRYPYGDAFSFGTVAIQVGKDIWVGAVRGDRIAIFPPTQPQTQ